MRKGGSKVPIARLGVCSGNANKPAYAHILASFTPSVVVFLSITSIGILLFQLHLQLRQPSFFTPDTVQQRRLVLFFLLGHSAGGLNYPTYTEFKGSPWLFSFLFGL